MIFFRVSFFGDKYIYAQTHMGMMKVGAADSAQGGRAPSRSLGAEGGCALRTPEAVQGPGPRTLRQGCDRHSSQA